MSKKINRDNPYAAKEKENQHREGYTRKPVRRGEFSGWEDEQVWPGRAGQMRPGSAKWNPPETPL
jgi:hypothetical protein